MEPNRAYATDVRILTCPRCGAPVQAAAAGGRVACAYCQSSLDVAPRNDATVGRAMGPAPTEAERMQGLWAQARAFGDQQLPMEMVTLLRAGPLTADRIAQALDLWRVFCQRATAGDAAAANHAVLLTGSITAYFAQSHDRVRQRALLESTLDAMPYPREKQVIRCQLARAAAAIGDFQAAQTWFGACDPAPSDLLADTAYRQTYAYLATARGDFQNVLAALGPAPESVPVAMTNAVILGVIRANAHEKLGNVQGAVAQLVAIAAAFKGAPQAIPAIVAANPSLQLCPQSLPWAMQQFQAR